MRQAGLRTAEDTGLRDGGENELVDEFALIRRYFSSLTPPVPGLVMGVGDDCALLSPAPDKELAITTDTLISGRHFPAATDPADIGWKALAVNLSDLAAMGAGPWGFLLALTLPTVDPAWLDGFSSGLREMATAAGVALVGGDTTRGPLSITITALGWVPRGKALLRSGAQLGDRVCVTGTLGDAALGLRVIQGSRPGAETAYLEQRLNRPTPRLEAGVVLRDWAHAAVDLSDGLAGDLHHILVASQVGAVIDVDKLPMSGAFAALHAPSDRLALQAAGGDDYELCFCAPAEALPELRERMKTRLTDIGEIQAAPGLRWRDPHGRTLEPDLHAYSHF